MLAAAGKQGGFELKDMARYLPQLSAQAKSLGLSGPEGLATLGSSLQIAMKGTGDASSAAGNLNNFLNKLTAPETIKRFEQFGLNVEQTVKAALSEGKDPVVEMIEMIQYITEGDKFKIGELFGDAEAINSQSNDGQWKSSIESAQPPLKLRE